MAAVSTSPVEKTESRAEADAAPQSSAFWLRELEAAGKRDKDWIERAKTVVQRYRDERSKDNNGEKRANILWSNTEILKGALFRTLGNPDVRRRFPKRGKDEKNTKQAALVMERGASYANEAYDCESQIEACVEDMVLPGRGTAWVVYDAVVRPNQETGEDEVIHQTVRDEHVYWEDFRHSSGRKWSPDVWWAARCHYYSRDELNAYFPEHGKEVPLNSQLIDTVSDRKRDEDDTFKRARVWEIWDKTKRRRIYVAEDYQFILKEEEDPYRLTDFFPCPEPLYGVKTTSSLVPIPEFTLYQDQADELDVIATRLARLVEALKRRGVYDASSEGPDNKLSALAFAKDNEFLPYRGFAGLMEKGGLKAVFQTEDLAPIVAAIEGLYKRAVFLVQSIYEVTGISDIMRGSQEHDQTATEASLKANFGSLRLKKRQRRVDRFVRDLIRIKAEIIAEHFTREQLQEMTGLDLPLAADKQAAMQQLQAFQQQAAMAQQMQQQAAQQGQQGMMGHNGGPPMGGGPQPPAGQPGAAGAVQPPDPAKVEELQQIIKLPSWEDVAAILRSDQRRGYKVDVETDQTANLDEQEEKNSRIEFMSTMQGLMEKAIPLAMQMPMMRPLVKESVMFVVKAFKAGRSMEETFEDAFAQLEKMPPPQNQGDPVAAAKAKEIETKTQLSVQEAKAGQQTAMIEQQRETQAHQADMALKGADLQLKRQDMQIKAQDAQAQRAIQMREAAFNLNRNEEKAAMDREMDYANRDLAEITNRIQAAEAVEGFKANRRSEAMSMAERRQKMQHAERAANRPAQ